MKENGIFCHLRIKKININYDNYDNLINFNNLN